jgi:hypothetical protein
MSEIQVNRYASRHLPLEIADSHPACPSLPHDPFHYYYSGSLITYDPTASAASSTRQRDAEVAPRVSLWETVGMPKDRKKTYSDRQSQASRDKKQAKKKAPHEGVSQAPARIVREASANK